MQSCALSGKALTLHAAVRELFHRAVAALRQHHGSRPDADVINSLGIDEKSFKSGQHYVTVLNNLEEGRVLEVVEHRTTDATKQALESLNQQQRAKVKAVSVDLWKPFASAVRELLPKADLVHDRFHISKYLNEAVDAVRRKESGALEKAGDKRLLGSKYVWLRNPENMHATGR
jgi:transposase